MNRIILGAAILLVTTIILLICGHLIGCGVSREYLDRSNLLNKSIEYGKSWDGSSLDKFISKHPSIHMYHGRVQVTSFNTYWSQWVSSNRKSISRKIELQHDNNTIIFRVDRKNIVLFDHVK